MTETENLFEQATNLSLQLENSLKIYDKTVYVQVFLHKLKVPLVKKIINKIKKEQDEEYVYIFRVYFKNPQLVRLTNFGNFKIEYISNTQ